MEFKRLSDVEVVAEPTESANVLIEENGVIKKAPKTAVGGGSDSYDAVITLESENNTGSLTSGNYGDLLAKIQSGSMPKVHFTGHFNYGADYQIEADAISVWTDGSVVIATTHFTWYGIEFTIASDGSVSHDW